MDKKYYYGISVLLMVVSFFLGMEFKAYQIKSAIEDVTKSFSSGFKNGFQGDTQKTTEKKKDRKIIKKGESFTIGDMKLLIESNREIGKEYNDGGFMKYTAKNKFYGITISGENIGKKESFTPLSSTFKLIDKNGVEYSMQTTRQLSSEEVGEGFGGCVSCGNNPKDKSKEEMIFDIKDFSFEGAKLISDEYQVEL